MKNNAGILKAIKFISGLVFIFSCAILGFICGVHKQNPNAVSNYGAWIGGICAVMGVSLLTGVLCISMIPAKTEGENDEE